MRKSLKNTLEHLSYLEIIIIDVFGQLDGRNIHASLGSQKVTLVDSSHGTTVQFQGSCKVKEKLDQLQNWFKIISSTVTIATLSSQNNDPKHCMRCIKCFWNFWILTGDKDESGCQLFEDNNTFSLVSSSKNDSNGSTSQRGSQSSLLLGEKFGGSTLGSPEKIKLQSAVVKRKYVFNFFKNFRCLKLASFGCQTALPKA